MRRTRLAVLVLQVLLSGLALGTSSGATAPHQADLAEEPYTNKEHGFAIRFPQGWRVKGSTVPETIIKARLPDREVPMTFMSVAVYPAPNSQETSRLSAEDLFREYILSGNDVDARITTSGRTEIAGKMAVWMEIDFRSPAIVSHYAIAYFFLGEKEILRVSGSTKRDAAWFYLIKPVLKASIESITFMESGGASPVRLHTEVCPGFTIRYPADWTKKRALTEETVLKAVKKSADGRFIMLTVSAQLLDRENYSVADMSDAEIVLLSKEAFGLMGGSKFELLAFGRGNVDGRPSAQVIAEIKHPQFRPKVVHFTNVINERHHYTIGFGCDKSLYAEYAHEMKQIANSFMFTSEASPSRPERQEPTPPLEEGRHSFRLPGPNGEDVVVTYEPGDSWPVALFKGYGQTFLTLFLASVAFAVGRAVWVKMRRKRRRERRKKNEQVEP